MCAAFVYGIAATSVIATSPCAHHIPIRSTSSAPSPIPVNARETSQPAGE